MTLDEAIKHAEKVAEEKFNNAVYIMDKSKSDIALSKAKECKRCAEEHRQLAEWLKDYKRLLQKSCDDAISRHDVEGIVEELENICHNVPQEVLELLAKIKNASPVTPQPKIGYCKDCKYFEYEHVAKVDGIPLILAHEICSRWGDGWCKTREDGYCFLFKPQKRSDKE